MVLGRAALDRIPLLGVIMLGLATLVWPSHPDLRCNSCEFQGHTTNQHLSLSLYIYIYTHTHLEPI